MNVKQRTFVSVTVILIVFLISTAHANGDVSAISDYKSKNYAEAMQKLKPLAEREDAKAQYYIGRMYEKGEGVDKDLDQAAVWYRRAAENGSTNAQYKMAVGYAFGFGGVKQDDAEAIKWLRRSAEGGYRRAQKVLSQAYAEGRFGLPVDKKLSKYWAKKAATEN